MARHLFCDQLLQAQEAVLDEIMYECDGKYGCGQEVPEDEIEMRIAHDCGAFIPVQICLSCIKRGWDEWGDPRT